MRVIAAHRRFRSKPQRALVNVKMTEMANQIKEGGVYHSQMHCISSDANYLIFFSNMAILRERERERKRENCKRPSLSTNNETEFSYLKYSNVTLIAEKYNVAIQYQLIKVALQH